jgi:hypothetical protein
MWLLSTFSAIFYCVNWYVVTEVIEAVDTGGSMTIFMFGAYFGLAASYGFKPTGDLSEVTQGN